MSSSLLSLDPRRPALRPLEGTTFAELRLNGGDFCLKRSPLSRRSGGKAGEI